MPHLTCDVAVIGAGTAGLAAERAARAAGARTLLIDPSFAGTTCAAVGCMPSKLLIAAAGAAHAVRSAGVFGIDATAAVDGKAVMTRVRRLRDAFVAGVNDTIADLPDGVCLQATARFVAPGHLALDDGRHVAARAIVIATGARPALPPQFAALGDCALTNETVFDLPDLPASLGVIGAGPLGLELAQAFAWLGPKVTLFDQGETLAGLKDEPAVAACLNECLERDMAIHLGVELAVQADEDGVRLTWSDGNITVERLLVAIGRPPALDTLDLAASGLTLDAKGIPLFDRATMRCGDSAVFLAGDADGERPVLHEASDEGAIAGRNAAAWPTAKPARRSTPLSIMFTDPTLAVIGEPGAADAIVGDASYAEQGRARVMATAAGLVRLYADPGSGRLRGAVVLAPAGEHLAHLLAIAIEQRLTATAMLALPFYHPTYEEGLKAALRAICAAVGTRPPADRDEGAPAGA